MTSWKLPAAVAVLGIGALTSGLLLHVPHASGYPAGAVVSYGANPVVAVGGSASVSTTTTLLTAPPGQDLVVTDVVLSGYVTYSCAGFVPVTFQTSGGATVAGVSVGVVQSNGTYGAMEATPAPPLNLGSGLPVPAGESLSMTTGAYSYGGCTGSPTIYYTVSGYHAEP
jgi:hypothetical protein